MAEKKMKIETGRDFAELRKRLKAIEDGAGKDALKSANKEMAEIVKDAVVVPTRSGNLASTVRTTAGLNYGSVKAGNKKAPYGAAIHWGFPRRWPNYAPQPFLYEALDSRTQQVIDRAARLADEYAALVAGDH